MTRSLALLALTSAALVAAQNTVSVFMPMYDQQDLVASIVAVDGDKTTFLVDCPSTADATECGVADGGQTVIYGTSTFSLHYAYDGGNEEGTYTEDINCKLNHSKDSATCSISVSQHWDDTTLDTSTVTATSGYLGLLMPISITAGLSKITDSASSDSSGSSGSSDSPDDSSDTTAAAPASTAGSDSVLATATATATATEKASSQSTGFSTSSVLKSESASTAASSSDSAATPTASGNAAGAKLTQNAVLAGAAVLVGGVMLL